MPNDTGLPFVVGILADLVGSPREASAHELRERRFISASLATFDAMVEQISPTLTLTLNDRIRNEGGKLNVTLRFQQWSDFSLDRIAQQIYPLARCISILDWLDSSMHTNNWEMEPPTEHCPSNHTNEIFDAVTLLDDESVSQICAEHILKLASFSDSLRAAAQKDQSYYAENLRSRLAQIVREWLAELICHPDFTRFESIWSGLRYLVDQASQNSDSRLQVLNISKRELFRDLERAIEFDQSALFKRIYDDYYGTAGEVPIALVVGDFEFENTDNDLSTLKQISSIAASASVPFVAAASARMLGTESFADLHRDPSLAKRFNSPEAIKWNSLRRQPDSRFMMLCLPRVTVSAPNAPKTNQYLLAAGQTERLVLINPAYAFAVWSLSQLDNGKCLPKVGSQEGRIKGLVRQIYRDALGQPRMRGPVEATIHDDNVPFDIAGFVQVRELGGFGFTAIHHAGTDSDPAFLTLSPLFSAQATLHSDPMTVALDRITATWEFLIPLCQIKQRLRYHRERLKLASQFTKEELTPIVAEILRDFFPDNSGGAGTPFSEFSVDIVTSSLGSLVQLTIKLGPATVDPGHEIPLNISLL